jgi:hypothetical protein
VPGPRREQVEDLYTLTDRLGAQLRALEESPAPVAQVVREAGTDVEAFAFLVLLEASRSAQAELAEILAQVKAIDDAKAKLRGAAAARGSLDVDSILELMLTLYGKSVDADLGAIRRRLDSLDALDEEESLRLQLELDRISKLMATLSNLLKKLADTADAIVQNLK